MTKLILLMAILATISCLGAFFLLTRGQEVPDIAEAVEDPIFEAAHDYHGIHGSYEIAGKYYFDRGDQRCRLFTEAFLKKYKKSGGKHELPRNVTSTH